MQENYSALDKLLHYIAFSHPRFQRILSEVESDLYKKGLQSTEIDRPVFVFGLPRAGTTLLLDLLYQTDEFASFTYRQMPFMLTPLLWDKISRKNQKKALETERAHGDGVSVSFDSPEAFEEIIWLNYLKKSLVENNYVRILQQADVTTEFEEGFKDCIRKLILLNNTEQPDSGRPDTRRYLSKNNPNLARQRILHSMFPDACFLICFRAPELHVASLQKQHTRFTELHAENSFSKKYMEWTGHYDFGLNFRPIRFGDYPQPLSPDKTFWLQYWIDAYKFALNNTTGSVKFVNFDMLLTEPSSTLADIAAAAQVHQSDRFVSIGQNAIRQPSTQGSSQEAGQTTQEYERNLASLQAEANEVYTAMCNHT